MTHLNFPNAPIEVYNAFQKSINEGTNDWQTLVSPNATFHTPLVRFQGHSQFVQFYAMRYKAIQQCHLRKLAVHDDYVITFSSLTFKKPNKKLVTLEATDWYTIEGGKIQAFESFGDASVLKDNKEAVFHSNAQTPVYPIVEKKASMTPLKLYEAFQQSMLEGTDEWRDLLSSDVTFTGPSMYVQGRDKVIEVHETWFATLEEQTLHKMAICDNLIVTHLAITIQANNKQSIVLEVAAWYTIKQGEISAIDMSTDPTALKKANQQ